MNNYVGPKGFATQKVWAALCKFAGTDTAYSLCRLIVIGEIDLLWQQVVKDSVRCRVDS